MKRPLLRPGASRSMSRLERHRTTLTSVALPVHSTDRPPPGREEPTAGDVTIMLDARYDSLGTEDDILGERPGAGGDERIVRVWGRTIRDTLYRDRRRCYTPAMKCRKRTVRGLRSALVALSTIAIAVAAHRAHGTTPPLLALVPVVLVAWGIAYALVGRRMARWELLALLGAAQVGIHGLSVYLTAPGHHDPGHSGIGDSSTPMVLTHAAATVLTALLLEYGERMWWGLLSLAGVRQHCACR
ncbi:hypothetical protein E1267_11325 [Nonomuraea longispora]|uniref:Uncharacterized protein n=1 Tax=Nonomuraea longispora TaxID=1848320 RepID=A0A4R4NGC0_9ACTN|nr:hypothetical protein [Nonomuraea longispora]TDC08059.1 hypothetical protein E1267_11325 [Nonomuraea longispora]